MTQYRASFDARVSFSNGGGLSAHGFRVDVPSRDTSTEEIAELFLASLSLLLAEPATLSNVRIFPEPHKGTHRGPSDRGGDCACTTPARQQLVPEPD